MTKARDTADINSGTNTAVGEDALESNTGSNNVAVGHQAGYNNTTGSKNTALGRSALEANTTANNNTAVGYQALLDNTTGAQNTSVGMFSLTNNISANYNAAFGYAALEANTTGGSNTALGPLSLYGNTTGSNNVAVGMEALENNTTASNNTAVGYQAGYTNTTGSPTAFGRMALYSNTTGVENTAVGLNALYGNTTGSQNVALGWKALEANTTAIENTAVGQQSLYNNTTGQQNTTVGQNAGYYITTGSKNTIIGRYTGNQGGLDIRTSSNNIVLSDGDGNPRFWNNANGLTHLYNSANTNTLHLFNSQSSGTTKNLIRGYYGVSNINGDNANVSFVVYTNGNVQNSNNSYTAISDQKLKENIVDANSQWDDIKDLQVRNYNMIEGQTHTQIGVIAQEVETVSAGLVYESPDQDGNGNDLGTVTKSVNYSVLYMKAVKALQEAMARIETLETKVTALEGA